MQFGKFTLHIINAGNFKLDGGAMFGIVPKNLWEKLIPTDEQNRIELATNCLLIEAHDKKILVETGNGTKLSEKMKQIFAMEPGRNVLAALKETGVQPEQIDVVINTHLHFDHAGGNTHLDEKGSIRPSFSNALYVIQKKEWEEATNLNERNRGSFMKDDYELLEKTGQLRLVDGETEIVSGVRVIPTQGHTSGHQSVLIESDGKKALFTGDLIPTASHLRPAYIMSFDDHPLQTLETKKAILAQAIRENWLLIFPHDSHKPAGFVRYDERQNPVFVEYEDENFQD